MNQFPVGEPGALGNLAMGAILTNTLLHSPAAWGLGVQQLQFQQGDLTPVLFLTMGLFLVGEQEVMVNLATEPLLRKILLLSLAVWVLVVKQLQSLLE
tara:strand:- start:1413 stop:1706 length:294 start_codon:yes stop_codon:yes gene_type:complete